MTIENKMLDVSEGMLEVRRAMNSAQRYGLESVNLKPLEEMRRAMSNLSETMERLDADLRQISSEYHARKQK